MLRLSAISLRCFHYYFSSYDMAFFALFYAAIYASSMPARFSRCALPPYAASGTLARTQRAAVHASFAAI